jgi:O-antigen/teichoic acid export membrane protein
VSFAKSSLETGLVRACLIATGLATGIINARWLGAEGVGILALLLLIKVVAFCFGNLGFGSAFAFFVARERAQTRAVLPVLFGLGLATAFASSAIVLAVWRLPFSPWNDIEPGLVHLCLPMVPLLFLRIYLQRLLSGTLRIREMNVSELIFYGSYLALLVACVVAWDLGLFGAVLSVLIADCLAVLFLLWRSLIRPDTVLEAGDTRDEGRPSVGQLWRYGRWNYLLMLSNFLVEELPLILLKSFSADNTPVGLMSRAQNLARLQRMAVAPVAVVLFPYTAASQEDEATRRTNILCRNSLVLIAALVGLLALFIRPILVLLYGEAFLPAAEIFYALAPGAAFWPVGHFTAIHLAASGHPKPAFLSSLAAAAVAAGLCAVLIPRYGAVGAGLSATGIYAVRTILLLRVYVRQSGTPLAEVVMPRKADWIHYRKLLGLLSLTWLRKAKTD